MDAARQTPSTDARLPVRLHGSKAPAISLGVLMLLVAGLVELAIGEAHHLAGWSWVPLLMVLPVLLLVARVVRGVLMDADGDRLVVRQLVGSQRIPASTISAIRLAGVVGERIEVVRTTGRTWSFAAPDSPDADRHRAVAAALAWLDAHGGAVPVQDGPLCDGEAVGFGPSRVDAWMAGCYTVLELFLLAATLWRMSDGSGGSHWAGWLAVLLELAALAVVWGFARPRVGARASVHGGPEGPVLRIHRTLAREVVVPARDVRSVQVTLYRRETPGLRVLTPGGWQVVPAGLRLHDRARPVTRFVGWLEQNGAVLEPSDEVPAGFRPRTVLSVVVVLGSWVAAAYAVDRAGALNVGILGGLFGSLTRVLVGRFLVADAVGLSPDASLLDAFPAIPVAIVDDPPPQR